MNNTKKLKLFVAIALGCFASASLFGQTVTLQIQKFGFNDSANEGIPAAFIYGIAVDTSGGGFGGVDWNNIGPSSISEGSYLSLADGTESEIYFGGRGNAQFDSGQELFGYVHNPVVSHDDGRGLGLPQSGHQYGVLWFPGLTEGDTAGPGESFGFYTNDDLTIPPAGATVDHRGLIPEAQRSADYTIVPEPSTYAAIFGFGVLLFVFLRRRFKK